MRTYRLALLAAGFAFACNPAVGQNEEPETRFYPVSVSLVSPLQIVSPENSTSFLRLNLIYGKNKHVEGFDFGVINRTTGRMEGIALGGVNWVGTHSDALQVGLLNRARQEALHIQLGLVNHAGINSGWQVGLFNCASDGMVGALQIGLLNYTREFTTSSWQIGLLNISRHGPVKVLPLVNGRF